MSASQQSLSLWASIRAIQLMSMAAPNRSNYNPSKSFNEVPSYDSLPYKRRFWVWGPPGSREEGLGMLNLLTPEHVARSAASEIRNGERVGLGWEFHKLEVPPFGRVPFQINVHPIGYARLSL
ncbi:hypothetical protein POJ06DRAFT_292717 [Lipomyces tetrasporus]|uniref:Uncharacterized protein n=1 Tax=Lipomyces tetrasporus TaxID=54092 RepID=A0AAD7QN83_9ASCO|nr:uncharacterized protein POJ06DRAFT_292717 [Lipomyces tetrasporus]KAJ8098100.1 hypothetical protein POJ06DRAFT_292717 [Lipomyces tetrasporus]